MIYNYINLDPVKNTYASPHNVSDIKTNKRV